MPLEQELVVKPLVKQWGGVPHMMLLPNNVSPSRKE